MHLRGTTKTAAWLAPRDYWRSRNVRIYLLAQQVNATPRLVLVMVS
jgi:hypothetical protein